MKETKEIDIFTMQALLSIFSSTFQGRHERAWFPYNIPVPGTLSRHGLQSETDEMIAHWNTANEINCKLYPELIETQITWLAISALSQRNNLTNKLLSTQYTSDWDGIIIILIQDQQRNKIQKFLLRYVFQATLYSIWNMQKMGVLE